MIAFLGLSLIFPRLRFGLFLQLLLAVLGVLGSIDRAADVIIRLTGRIELDLGRLLIVLRCEAGHVIDNGGPLRIKRGDH